jgi:Zn-dependent protease with chaperone function
LAPGVKMRLIRALAAVALVVATVAVGFAAGAPALLPPIVGYGVLIVVIGALRKPAVGRLGSAVRLSDPALTARIEAMARSMGIRTPEVVVFPGRQFAEAYASSILWPVVLIGEGVLHRLPPAERDAVIAHELGHFATRSLWVAPATAAAAGGIGLVASAATGVWEAALSAVPLWIVGRRLVMRGFEPWCDLAGARVVGFASMAGGLHRIHAIRDGAARFVRLLDATSSHPGIAVRRRHLRAWAPPEERARIPAEPVLTAHVASGLWAVTAAAAVAVGIAVGPIGVALFVVVAAVPVQIERSSLPRAGLRTQSGGPSGWRRGWRTSRSRGRRRWSPWGTRTRPRRRPPHVQRRSGIRSPCWARAWIGWRDVVHRRRRNGRTGRPTTHSEPGYRRFGSRCAAMASRSCPSDLQESSRSGRTGATPVARTCDLLSCLPCDEGSPQRSQSGRGSQWGGSSASPSGSCPSRWFASCGGRSG